MVLAGNGVARGRASDALRRFAAATGVPVAETFMGKGLVDADDPRALGAVGLQDGDYDMAGFADADLVLAVGYDLVEHAPKHWNPRGDKRIVCIDSLPAEIDDHFIPEVELVGDIAFSLEELARRCPDGCGEVHGTRLARAVAATPRGGGRRRRLPDAASPDPAGAAPGHGAGRRPGLRRRAAQAVDRADVPGPSSPTPC